MNAYGLARIGRDAEVRSTQNGDSVANLSLAFAWGKKGEDGKRQVTWADCSLWGKRADALAEYLVKGQLVMVGLEELHVEEYTDRDGVVRTKLAGRISSIEFAGPPPGSNGNGGNGNSGSQTRDSSRGNGNGSQRPQQRSSGTQQQRQAPRQQDRGFEDMDDDIPF